MVICQNYGHFAKKLRSVTVSQNHYINKILDVHPLLTRANKNPITQFNTTKYSKRLLHSI